MTDTSIEALERRVAEANAKVAEAAAAMIDAGGLIGTGVRPLALIHANTERTAALAAIEAAKKPQPLSAEEAVRTLCQTTDMQAVLDAAAERWKAVIEALPQTWVRDDEGSQRSGDHFVRLADIRTAMSRVKS